jgi:hypothetical protein
MSVARKCRFCGSYLDPAARPKDPTPSAFDRMLMPVGRPASAVAAGYCALFAILPGIGLPAAVMALVFGVMGLKKINADPSLSGRGRAWFGIIVGGIMTALSVIFVVIVIIAAVQDANRG